MPKKLPEIKVEMLAAALASGRALVNVVAEIGISESTGRRWKSDPSFDKRVNRIRAEIRRRTIDRYVILREKGADILEVLYSDPDPDIRLKAVRAVNADLATMSQGAPEAASTAPGLIVPGLDERWQPGAEGGET